MKQSKNMNFDSQGNYIGLGAGAEAVSLDAGFTNAHPIFPSNDASLPISNRELFESLAGLVDELFDDCSFEELETIRACTHDALIKSLS